MKVFIIRCSCIPGEATFRTKAVLLITVSRACKTQRLLRGIFCVVAISHSYPPLTPPASRHVASRSSWAEKTGHARRGQSRRATSQSEGHVGATGAQQAQFVPTPRRRQQRCPWRPSLPAPAVPRGPSTGVPLGWVIAAACQYSSGTASTAATTSAVATATAAARCCTAAPPPFLLFLPLLAAREGCGSRGRA